MLRVSGGLRYYVVKRTGYNSSFIYMDVVLALGVSSVTMPLARSPYSGKTDSQTADYAL